MPRRVKADELFPPMTWPQREAAWKDRERHLLLDRKAAWEQLGEASGRADRAEAEVRKLKSELSRARKRIAELESMRRAGDGTGDPAASKSPPPWVKPNVAKKPRKAPGREAGHAAALRPMPGKIDQVVEVPLARDERGRALCPRCRCVLTDLRPHARVVEDLTPSNVRVTKFKTRSGHCVNCDARVESRAADQPPAADVPHGQIGLNALALGVMLRVRQRLPLRQICAVFRSDEQGQECFRCGRTPDPPDHLLRHHCPAHAAWRRHPAPGMPGGGGA